MIQKMLRHTVMSVFVIGLFAGGYALTLGSGLQFAHEASSGHSHDQDEG